MIVRRVQSFGKGSTPRIFVNASTLIPSASGVITTKMIAGNEFVFGPEPTGQYCQGRIKGNS